MSILIVILHFQNLVSPCDATNYIKESQWPALFTCKKSSQSDADQGKKYDSNVHHRKRKQVIETSDLIGRIVVPSPMPHAIVCDIP